MFLKVFASHIKNITEIRIHNPSIPSIKFIAFIRSNKHRIVNGMLK
jgi:hypothetical protein